MRCCRELDWRNKCCKNDPIFLILCLNKFYSLINGLLSRDNIPQNTQTGIVIAALTKFMHFDIPVQRGCWMLNPLILIAFSFFLIPPLFLVLIFMSVKYIHKRYSDVGDNEFHIQKQRINLVVLMLKKKKKSQVIQSFTNKKGGMGIVFVKPWLKCYKIFIVIRNVQYCNLFYYYLLWCLKQVNAWILKIANAII